MGKIKKLFRDMVVKHIYQITTSENYLSVIGNEVFIQNKQISSYDRDILIREAKYIIETNLYKSIIDNRNYIAQQELIKNGEGYIDSVKATYLITLEDMRVVRTLAALTLDKR